MPMACVRFVAFASVLILLAGCGGGSGGGGTGSGGGGGNPPTTVTFNFSGPAPTAVAAHIGSGAFTAQTLNSGKLSLSIPSGTTNFAVAYLCPPFSRGAGTPTYGYQFVVEASTADGTDFTPAACPHLTAADPSGTLTGNMDANAIAGASSIIIDAESGSSFAEDGPISPGNFSFSAPAGTDRVELLAYENTQVNAYTVGLSLVAAKDFSSQTVPGQLNGGNTVVFGVADATTQQPITYNSVPTGFSAPTTMVVLDMGASEFLVSLGATNQFPALPPAATESGDFYDFTAISQVNGQAVAEEVTSTGASPVTLTFPAPWPYAGPTAAALPTFGLDYTGFSGKPGVLQTAITSWTTGSAAQSWYQVSATANYQGGSTTMAMPDLSGLAGFLPAPGSGTQVTWVAEVTQSSAGVFQPLTVNTTTSAVENLGAFTVP